MRRTLVKRGGRKSRKIGGRKRRVSRKRIIGGAPSPAEWDPGWKKMIAAVTAEKVPHTTETKETEEEKTMRLQHDFHAHLSKLHDDELDLRTTTDHVSMAEVVKR